MLTTDALRRALDGDGTTLTLDRGFQGLPDTAHGGSVLAAFDLVAAGRGPRALRGQYLRRVPLGVPLRLTVDRASPGDAFTLSDGGATLVEGALTPPDGAAITFVAVRGAARRLAAGMLAVNPPELLRRVFPGYAR